MAFELDLTPDELPVPVKATNNMKVLHMDPLGKGAGVLPREISVQNTGADGALVYAMYSGFPAALAVDDYVICWSDDNDTIMRVAASGGPTAMNEGLLADGTVVGATAQAQVFGGGGGVTLDDGTGNSPSLKFVGGSNDDTAELFLEDDAVAGDSDLIVKLADDAGDSKLIVRDSADADVVAIGSNGYVKLGDIATEAARILHVSATQAVAMLFESNNVNGTFFDLISSVDKGTGIRFADSSVTPAGRWVIGADWANTGDFHFLYNVATLFGAAALTIKQSGFTGIGTESPAQLFEIENSEAVTAIQISNAGADGDPVIILALSGTPKITMGVDDGDGDDFKIGTTAIGTSTRLRIGGTNGELETTSGRIVNTTRITGATTLDSTHYMVFADTDAAAFPVTLPAGVEGTMYRITNVGTSGNDVTVDGNGAETVMGAVTQALSDGETMILIYNTTEGWW